MTGINSYSTTASENILANTGIIWDEGMAPGQVNNSARQNMADIRAAFDDLIWFQYGIGSKAVAHLYASGTSTTLAGADVTAVYHAGRRVKAVGSSTGTIYGAVASSAYAGGNTTVNYNWDSGALSSEALTIYLSQVPVTGNPVGLAAIPGLTTLFRNFLSGLTLSTAGSSASFGVAAGGATDSSNAAVMTLASAYTKTTSAWAVGSGNGALDTGSIANSTWYHVWLIQRPDTGVVDILCSLSATSPTMPSNYTLKRRIGSMLTDGSAHWLQFTQWGDDFYWAVPISFANNTVVTNGMVSVTLGVPTGIQVRAKIRGDFGSGASFREILVQSLVAETAAYPGAVAGNYNSVSAPGGNTSPPYGGASFNIPDILTNTSGQVQYTYNSGGGAGITGVCYGWSDLRDRN